MMLCWVPGATNVWPFSREGGGGVAFLSWVLII